MISTEWLKRLQVPMYRKGSILGPSLYNLSNLIFLIALIPLLILFEPSKFNSQTCGIIFTYVAKRATSNPESGNSPSSQCINLNYLWEKKVFLYKMTINPVVL